MTRLIRLREFERRPRDGFPPNALARLEHFDRATTEQGRSTALDWSFKEDVRAKSWVGVVCVPGLSLEILPKLESSDADSEQAQALSRRNLLYMLTVAGEIPLSERDLASQGALREPLLEILVTAFVRRLQTEVRRGIDHAYHDREEDCPFLRGKLLVADHVTRNVAHRERFAVRYSVFGVDTPINRILKASCARLHQLSSSLRNRTALTHALQLFEPVGDNPVSLPDFQRVVFNRGCERFRPLIEFCRLLWTGQSPTLTHGASTHTFSLLFPMETVFEAFIGRIVVRYASDLGLRREDVHVQARGRARHLLRDENGRPAYRLAPDILIEDRDGPIVLDTKWKRLGDSRRGVSASPSQADIYQLNAYASCYGATRNVLLFPHVAGVRPSTWALAHASHQRFLVRHVDLSHDLRRNPRILIAALAEAIGGYKTLRHSP